jgi:hypothetical protein
MLIQIAITHLTTISISIIITMVMAVMVTAMVDILAIHQRNQMMTMFVKEAVIGKAN